MPPLGTVLNAIKKALQLQGFYLKSPRVILEIQLLVFHVNEYPGHAVE